MIKQEYPKFSFIVTSHPDNWEVIADLIKDEWRLSKTFDGFYVCVERENPSIFVSVDSLYSLLLILEKYMGHLWMTRNGLMRREKVEKS